MIAEEVRTVPDAVLVGRLQREYILPAAAPARLDGLGGNLAYAAAAFASWGGQAGLVSRVSADFPMDQLTRLESLGFFLDGVHTVSEPLDSRYFVAYGEGNKTYFDNPITHLRNGNCPSRRSYLAINPAGNTAARRIMRVIHSGLQICRGSSWKQKLPTFARSILSRIRSCLLF